MARHTLTPVFRGAINPDETPDNTVGFTFDSFADLTQPHVLAALGFVRERSGRATVWTSNVDDTSLVMEVPPPPTSRSYRRPVVTVNMVAGWHPVVSYSFVCTNSPVEGPAYRSQTKATRNNQQKAITQ